MGNPPLSRTRRCLLKTFKFLLFAAIVFGVERFCHHHTEGFQLYKIASELPYNPSWETSPLPTQQQQEIDAILDQPFFFLGSGGQSYAFESKDKKTVLKLFKHHHMRPKSWLNTIPLPFFLEKTRERIIKQRTERLSHILGSFKIAYENLQSETGVFYLHLNHTPALHQSLILVDNIGIQHRIDLNVTQFALQKKAEMAYPRLNTLMQEGDLVSAKECIDTLLSLIVKRCQKGILDEDAIIKRNFGFLGNQAVTIDLGSFVKDDALKESSAYKKELLLETLKFKKWLRKRHPQLAIYFKEKLHSMIEENP